MKSATLFYVVGALSDDGAGFAISWCFVLPSVRVVETHTLVLARVISCPHVCYIDHSGGIFRVFVTIRSQQLGRQRDWNSSEKELLSRIQNQT
jgi:hypothetical protein